MTLPTFPDLPGGLTVFDAAAVLLLVVMWTLCGWIIENPPARRPSVTVLMRGYRREWMAQIVSRDPRVFDAAILSTLRDSTAFFASTCMLAIGGGVALIGNVEWVRSVAGQMDLADDATAAWEIKILLALAIVARAFLNFVWSNRLHGYCAVMMAAIPNDPTDPRCAQRAHQAAELNIAAARRFSSGLRAIYFALGGLGWLLGPWGLLLTTVLAVWWVILREFASRSRVVVLEGGLSPDELRR